ncbi:signal peptidase II [Streptomyces sp. NPDC017529]|uniref:signal peptidase II n=1 Tax=Streptomyces sp. NPDC017529 TaxID=3365000 RepID=UPI0037891D6B
MTEAEQAAGPAVDGRDGEAAAERRGRRIPMLLAVTAFVYLLDLGSKLLVVAKLEDHDPVEVIGTWLRLRVLRNRGAAFGFGEAMTIVFTLVAAAVIVVVVRLARKLYSAPWAIALGLLLGGALGNLTDRVFRSPGGLQGGVVDFIAAESFAVFNIADSAICCGCVLLVFLSFRGVEADGTVRKD